MQTFDRVLDWLVKASAVLAALILAVGPILAGIVKLTPGNLGLTESLTWMRSRSVPKSIESVAARAAAMENRTGWCSVSDSRYLGCCSVLTSGPRSPLT